MSEHDQMWPRPCDVLLKTTYGEIVIYVYLIKIRIQWKYHISDMVQRIIVEQFEAM